MKRAEITELHNIVSISNVGSIIQLGILSHREADRRRVRHESIANVSVQQVRRRKQVPGGQWLHEYACLYLNARNPMMYVWKDRHAELCILQIHPSVLDVSGAVVSDVNAARGVARFEPASEEFQHVESELVLATWWKHDDPLEMDRRKAAICAEVLIPNCVDPGFITGAHVSCRDSKTAVETLAPGLPITISPHLFFQ